VQVIVTTATNGSTAIIGAGGGTLVSPGSVRLTIPPGALSKDTLVEVVPSALPPPAEMDPLTKAYDLLPSGLTFQDGNTATVELPLPQGSLVAVVYLTRANGSGWDLVGGASWGGSIKAAVTHFGTVFAANPQ
jgi:hypothetical protein